MDGACRDAALAGCGGKTTGGQTAAAPGADNSGGDIVLTRNDAIGAKYGAPGPRTCSTDKTPQDGPPSADQISKYVICSSEEERPTEPRLYLIDQVKIAGVSAGRPYNPNEDVNMSRIDITKPVYDIEGTSVSFACNQIVQPGEYDGGPDYHPGAQCTAYTATKAKGVCYQNTLHEWWCGMTDVDSLTNGQHGVAPPPAD
jgi:hypothetical protein